MNEAMSDNSVSEIKVSVIIPAYNCEAYIKRCLDSVVGQTYENLEIIIVDDGSSDSTASIADEYSRIDDRVHVIHKQNGGALRARLDGVNAAHGNYIGFVDSDDSVEADMYERLVSNADKYGADISHCGYKLLFSDGRINCFHNTRVFREQDNPTGLRDLLEGELVEPGLCNKLYKRELFTTLPYDLIFDSGIVINEDLLLNFFLFTTAEKSVFEDICEYLYYVRDGSLCRTEVNFRKINDPVKVMNIIMEHAPDELKETARAKYINTLLNGYNHTLEYDMGDGGESRKQIFGLIKENIKYKRLLKRKNRALITILAISPRLYKSIYSVYRKYFRKSKYI